MSSIHLSHLNLCNSICFITYVRYTYDQNDRREGTHAPHEGTKQKGVRAHQLKESKGEKNSRAAHRTFFAFSRATMTLPPTLSSAAIPFGRGNIHVARRGYKNSILLVALSRPRVKNAFSDDLYLDLVDVLQEAAADETLSALVLTGNGSYFSSGADLKGNFMPEEDGGTRDTLNKPAGKFMMALLSFPKLVAAAVQGPAVGIAVTLLLHCDLCFCTPHATFWAPFTRIALVPEFCSSTTLVETMGVTKANELLMLSRKIDAETALQWNLCSRVVKDCDASGDPFHPNSIASYMSREIDEQLLKLPRGHQTAQVRRSFVTNFASCWFTSSLS